MFKYLNILVSRYFYLRCKMTQKKKSCFLHSILFFFFRMNSSGIQYSVMKYEKMIKFGTIVEMVMNSDWTNFAVSRINSIAPPPKFTFLKVVALEHFVLEK